MSRPRLLYLVTEDWTFVAHRLPMARAARDAGFEVHVATRVSQHRSAIEAEGFQIHPLNLYRGSVNPLAFLRAIASVRKLYRALKADVVHHVTLQATVIGSLAAFGLPLQKINSIFGLTLENARGLKSKFAWTGIRVLLPSLLNDRRALTLVENSSGRDRLISFGVDPQQVEVFPGSGVDVTHFVPLPMPPGPVTIGYAGRMLRAKGVETVIAAHDILASEGRAPELLLAGEPDLRNPDSLTRATLESWSRKPGIRWIGHISDVRSVWDKAHIAVLISAAEGLPVSLLEAAACGRPIIASDIPGCREIARDGVNALLVPVGDAIALANAIRNLAADTARQQQFGAASRKLVEEHFSSERVGREIVAIYRRVSASAKAR